MASEWYSNSDYLKQIQYKTDSNLSARQALHEHYSTNTEPFFGWMFDRIQRDVPADANVLEVGCGNGIMWEKVAASIPAGWTLTITDMSEGMIEKIQQVFAALGVPNTVKFEVVNAESLPYADNVFDLVIGNYMMYHVPDREKAVAEFRRVLKPSGKFAGITNGERHQIEIRGFLRAAVPEHPAGHSIPMSSPFTLENGEDQLKTGFETVTLERFPNGLQVDAAQPIIDYIHSFADMPGAAPLTDDQVGRLSAHLEGILSENGVIEITKDTGLFIAHSIGA